MIEYPLTFTLPLQTCNLLHYHRLWRQDVSYLSGSPDQSWVSWSSEFHFDSEMAKIEAGSSQLQTESPCIADILHHLSGSTFLRKLVFHLLIQQVWLPFVLGFFLTVRSTPKFMLLPSSVAFLAAEDIHSCMPVSSLRSHRKTTTFH